MDPPGKSNKMDFAGGVWVDRNLTWIEQLGFGKSAGRDTWNWEAFGG